MTGVTSRGSPDVWSVPLLVALCVATFGLYVFYWFNRVWHRLGRMGYVRGSAGSRTVVFLLPLLNIVLVYELFNAIHRAARDKGLRTFSTPGVLTLLAVMLGGLSLVVGLLPIVLAITESGAPHIHAIISSIPFRAGRLVTVFVGAVSAAVIPAVSQGTLNALQLDEPASRSRHRFSLVEAVFLTAGGVLWLFNLL